MLKLTEVINQIDLIDIYRIFDQNKKECICLSEHYETIFSPKTDHILSHEASLKGCKKIEITPFMLSDLHGLKLDTHNRNNKRLSNSWILSD